jgi:hypothetical protein
VTDTDRVLMRALVGRAVGDRGWVEHDDIGEVAGGEATPPREAQILRR